MILCLARPELLDIRPGWGGGRVRAAAIELEPLAPAESEELLDALLADRELSTSERQDAAREDRGQPALRRGDDADAARGRDVVEADPRHAPGDDRRPHRPAAARARSGCCSAPP